jgi:predicted ATPase
MITNIKIRNFKAIDNSDLGFGKLNLFTGLNASGKSSFLQSILLLRQSFFNGNFNRRNKSLFLGKEDSLVSLGTFSDVFSQNAQKDDHIDFVIAGDHLPEIGFTTIPFNYFDEKDKYKNVNSANQIDGGLLLIPGVEIEDYSFFSSNQFQYLCADRISPREDYPRFEGDELLGKDGRFTAHFLEKYGNSPIPLNNYLKHESEETDTLLSQVNAWLNDISPGVVVTTKENLDTNKIELSYHYRTQIGIPTLDRKPQNVGHGITPTLPIVVALLSAKVGDLIIIENPETHIHPKGQARLAMLIAKTAKAGVQIIVETHSDHILNGIRVATKRSYIHANDVKINFFSRTNQEITTIQSLRLDVNGRIDKWPEGFFDEWDNLLDELI